MRKDGWEQLLYHHILEARGKQFAYGTHDCVLWCADWIEKITSEDLAKDWRNKYSNEQEAKEVLGVFGFTNYSDFADHYLKAISVPKARRGDIMLHPAGMLGICDGAYAYFLTEKGVLRIAFTQCTQAWKVE